jgi:hypothetical protein
MSWRFGARGPSSELEGGLGAGRLPLRFRGGMSRGGILVIHGERKGNLDA